MIYHSVPLTEKEKMDRYWKKVQAEKPEWRKKYETDVKITNKIEIGKSLLLIFTFLFVIFFSIGLTLIYISPATHNYFLSFGIIFFFIWLIIVLGIFFYIKNKYMNKE